MRYVYGYTASIVDDEVVFSFPKFPEIISHMPTKEYESIEADSLRRFLLNALVVSLQSDIVLRRDVPPSDNPDLCKADGFISMPVHQAMKLELYRVYKENCRSIADFARQLNKTETLARRLLDLRHRSFSTEIENAVELFGKELVHDWRIELSPIRHTRPHPCQPSHPHPSP